MNAPRSNAQPGGAAASAVLQLREVGVRRLGREVLAGIDLQVDPGEFVAVVGPNGAGKSSLLRAVTGEWPCSGQVHIGGRELGTWPREPLARRLAVMTQHPHLAFDFTVREVVALGRLPHRGAGRRADARVVAEVLDALALAPFAERSYLALSGGERQRVQFARVAAQVWEPAEPALLLLDEPTSALDLAQQQSVLGLADALRARGVAVVAVLHDLNLAARYADRVALLRQGRLCALAPPDEALRPDALQAVFGVEVERLDSACDGRPLVVVRAAARPTAASVATAAF